MVTADKLIQDLDFETIFKEEVLSSDERICAYEKKKEELEHTFRELSERLKGAPLEKGIMDYIDEHYHKKEDLFYGEDEVVTKAHCEDAHRLVSILAREVYGDSESAKRDIKLVEWAAVAHDVAKSIFPPEILYKMVEPDESELSYFKAHPIISYYMLKDIPVLEEVNRIVLYHEEFHDGKGPVERFVNHALEILKEKKRISRLVRPIRIRRRKIPKGAMILAVADAYASMVSRNYTEEDIIQEFEKQLAKPKGEREFDPKYLKIGLNIIREGRLRETA
jgi:HD-GYP domain-containing protein (c-di-GMP phosphodiesterase class II)